MTAPQAGEYLDATSAREGQRTDLRPRPPADRRPRQPTDQAEALYRFVDGRSPTSHTSRRHRHDRGRVPQEGSGDAREEPAAGALLRNRGIPARLVTGLTLSKGDEPARPPLGRGLGPRPLDAVCPFYHHFGRVPATYLVFGFGDRPVVRGRHVHDLDYAFLVEPRRRRRRRRPRPRSAAATRVSRALSLYALPPAEQRLVEFLLLLPVAALIICVFRNVIGLTSFGTFAPALIGLAFRDLHSLPGILVFVSILLIGWLMRRVLDRYHLLQVPRVALMLSLIMIVLIVCHRGRQLWQPGGDAVTFSLFPMVILTGMVERFWTLETEDSTASSFKTLLRRCSSRRSSPWS